LDVPRETPGAEKLFGAGLEKARAYAQALATTGAERGLIGPREVPRIWDRHLLNCAAIADLVPTSAEVADVGSGAGLPGLVLAIARPDLTVYLVEPLLRRVTWLRETIGALDLSNVEIIRARANVVAESLQRFDVVTARAVAPLPTLVEWCLPLVRPGGDFLAMKGDSAGEELAGTESTLQRFGAKEWSLVACGTGVLEIPTTVVRVVAGDGRMDHGRAAPGRRSAKKRSAAESGDATRGRGRRAGPPAGRRPSQ
jgi:16S rRNA (guanine527-N7)-methyltransferase